ncbi:MAG: hypothetical protein K6F84_08955 [Lachnospiraceae bacterium]|nr:hypothetical protein [Lachnospiraceae bacterium]
MVENKNTGKLYKVLMILMVVGSIAAMLKLIFVGFCQDEEYQIVMAYRRAMGDVMFKTMWEPHQMSSFFNAPLIKLFMMLSGGTDGLVIFLRICGTLFHIGVTVFVNRVLKNFFDKKESFLITLVYFNISVGLFATAEYSNLLFWCMSLTVGLMILAFRRKEEGKSFLLYLVLSGITFSLAVLAFPMMVILAPFIAICVVKAFDKKRILAFMALSVPCVLMGSFYVGYHILEAGSATFFKSITKITSGDPTHLVQEGDYWISKIMPVIKDTLLFGGIGLAIILIVFAGFRFLKKDDKNSLTEIFGLSLCISMVLTAGYWFVFKTGYECGQIYIPVLFITLLIINLKREKKHRFYINLILTVAFFAIISGEMLSNMEFNMKFPHGAYLIPAFLAVLLKDSQDSHDKKREAFATGILIFVCFFFIFAKGFMLRTGIGPNNITCVRNVTRTGPAKGIFTDYMGAFIMDADYAEWKDHVNEGDKVLIVTNTLQSNVLISYMYENVTISHYSMLNPFAYNEMLLEYWKEYPERYPDVIVCDCWYGDLLLDKDSWIYNYIENEFAYTNVTDGKYLRYYRR